MSDDRRKNLRTQGKYSDGKVQKSRDKKQKSSLAAKDSPEMRLPKKVSDDNKGVNNSLTDEGSSPLKYEENSNYTFHQLEEVAKPEEIKGRGEVVLSNTDNGKSRILYDPQFLHCDEGDNYFNLLHDTIQFDERNIVIHGVEYPQPRLVAWFGPFPYSYSGVTLEAAEMPDVVLEIKGKVEAFLKSRDIDATFNSVLINLYRDGKDSVSWHSDDEIMLGICPTIASVSLGETRKFEMKPKIWNHDNTGPSNSACKYFINLVHGSLVVMTGAMQDDWQHRVPKEYHDRRSRINLTFRTVHPLEKVIHLVRKRRSLQRKSWNRTPYKKISFDSEDLSFSDRQRRHDLLVDDERTHERKRKRKLSDSYLSGEESCARKHKRKRSNSYVSDEETSVRRHKRKPSDSYVSDEEACPQSHRRKACDSYVSDDETFTQRQRKKSSGSCMSDEKTCKRKHERKPSDSYVNDEETCPRTHRRKKSDSHESDEVCRRKHRRKKSDSHESDEESCPRRHRRKPSDSYLSDEEARPRRRRRKSSDSYVSNEETSTQRHRKKSSNSCVRDEEPCDRKRKRKPSDSYASDEEACSRKRKPSDSHVSDKETCTRTTKKDHRIHMSDEETCAKRQRRKPSDSDNTD